ncbi:hypothetical protein DQE82_03725 [Micromonospora sp. LHW51205]|uniref:hypothetical protein n=1 Tax=Micromonospora sp. LHW51205 TaxID=2248752 RepID=UPI000DEBDD67|nr:hypothetical protein [Micromonospora sp. LHW51205]RBQ12881.1 hypothetical protein DQE82_03725 [Micromonospora sp. LHW51205]
MTKIFFIEMRRSPLRWWLPFLVLVDVSMLFSRSTEWIGVWPQTSAAAQLPVFYFAIILAAGAAWASGRVYRSETTENMAAAASPPWRREAIQLATTVVYGLMPFLVGTVVAAVTTAIGDSPRGFLWPGYLVLATVLIVCTCALGHLLGRTIQSKIAAPLIGPVVVFMIVGFGVLPFLELAVLSGAPQFKVELAPMLARLALAAALVGAALSAGGTAAGRSWSWFGRGYQFQHAAYLASAGAVVLSLVLIYVAGPLRSARPAPEEPLCSDSTPKVCVWPEQRVHLARMVPVAERLGALSAVLVVPGTFYEEGLRGPLGSNSDFALVLGDWAATRGMVSTSLNDTFGVPACEPMNDLDLQRNAEAFTILKEWIVARVYGPKPSDIHGGFEYDEEELTRVLASSESQQVDWARSKIAIVRETTCGG